MNASSALATNTTTIDTLPAPASRGEVAWDVDPTHSSAGFKVRHLMVSHVRGELGPISGTIWIDDGEIERSHVDVSIDARAIDSKNEKRDQHLRSADFLDVANHPTVTFRSTSVKQPAKGQRGQLLVVGQLTIREVSQPVTLEVESLSPVITDPWGNTKRGATARARINRKDWGLKWNMALETGGVLVDDEIAIEIEVELVKRPV